MRIKTALMRLVIGCVIGMPFLVAVSVAQDMLQLGQLSYSRAEAPHLRTPVTRSFRFFRAVGGVAFSAVAKGEGGLTATALRYDPSAPDGQRLLVTVAAPGSAPRLVRAAIFDWQLVPIAKFAVDENGSAMTLFGQLDNKTQEEDLLKRKGRIINYHPALDNTLVGLRLMQADILIIQPNAVHLFREGGKILLGAGERGHDPRRNLERFMRVSEWQRQQSEMGNTYQSYVVGDLDQAVRFAVSDGKLVLSGAPFWTAWRSKFDPATVSARAKELLPRYRELAREHDAEVDRINAQIRSMSSTQLTQAKQRLAGMRSKVDETEKELEALQAVETMPQYSQELSTLIRQQDGVNPIVYDTVETVMHFRALFKHVQGRDREGYAGFVRSLAAVAVAPAVSTPTVQYASETR